MTRRFMRFFLMLTLLTAAVPASAEVVAVVNGENIEYDSISNDDKTLTRIDGSPLSEEERIVAVRTANDNEVQNLIRKKIVVQTIKNSGISLTAGELDAALAEEVSYQAMTPEFLSQIQRHFGAQVKALKEYLKSPERSDAIYQEHLTGFMPKQGWDLLREHNATPEMIERMEALIPKSLDEWKKGVKPQMERAVLRQKLEDRISKDVVIKENEIKRAYETKYADRKHPPFETVRDQIAAQLLTDKKEKFVNDWWQDRYRSAKIEIRDERYKGVIDLLRSEPS